MPNSKQKAILHSKEIVEIRTANKDLKKKKKDAGMVILVFFPFISHSCPMQKQMNFEEW